MGQLRARRQRGDVHGGVLMDLDHVLSLGSNHLEQPVGSLRLRKLPLLQARRQARSVRQDPELQKLHGLALRAVLLRMLGAGTERHQLHAARLQGAVIAQAVGVAKASLPDVGDALHVGVRMHRPNGARRQPVVIEDAQRPDPHLPGIAVAVEGEVPARVEPAAFLFVDLPVAAHLQHGCAQGTWIERFESPIQ